MSALAMRVVSGVPTSAIWQKASLPMADMPSIDAWLREAKADPSFRACGMYLVHNGTVRETPKAEARGIETDGVQPGDKVTSMHFSYDEDKVAAAVEEARTLPGIGYVRVWLNSGELAVGDDIMLMLIGGDIRPRVIDGLQHLVATIKNECVNEIEHGEGRAQ